MKKQAKGAPYSSTPQVEYLAAAAEERMMGTPENIRYACELERRAVGPGLTDGRLRYSVGLALVLTWQNESDTALQMLFKHDNTEAANRALHLIISMAELVFNSGEIALLRECLSNNPGGKHKIWQRLAKRLRNHDSVEATTKGVIAFALNFGSTGEPSAETLVPSPQPTAPTVS